jgi:hypothetical protein
MKATLTELDRWLARILQALEKQVGSNKFVFVVTADQLVAFGLRLVNDS